MNYGLFRRTKVKHNDNSEIIEEHYTDGRGTNIKLWEVKNTGFYVSVEFAHPSFEMNFEKCLGVDNIYDAREVSAIAIEEYFKSITATLEMTSDAWKKQVDN